MVKNELPIAFAIQRRWREVAGEQEKEAHEAGLIRGAEEDEQNA